MKTYIIFFCIIATSITFSLDLNGMRKTNRAHNKVSFNRFNGPVNDALAIADKDCEKSEKQIFQKIFVVPSNDIVRKHAINYFMKTQDCGWSPKELTTMNAFSKKIYPNNLQKDKYFS